jgi:EpsI family protein
MSSVRTRVLLAMALMLAGAGLSYVGRPTVYLADRIGQPDLETMFPKQFGEWKIQTGLPVVALAPDVQARLDAIYNQVLTRTYVNSEGRSIMLSVAYGGDQSDAARAHRPEICYPSQGFNITYNQPGVQQINGGSLPVRKLMSNFGARQEPITYWIVVGNEIVTSGMEQKLAQMRYGLRGLIPDGMLVRVSSIDADREHAYAVHADFIADLAAGMPADLRPRAFGEPSL